MEAQGQRTNRQTLLPALVSGLPAQHSHLQLSSRLKAHLVMASGWTLMLRGVCGASGALFQALKELILLQVVVAGRGASAGAYSPSRCFDLCFPSRGEPVGADLLPGRPGERLPLPAPHSPGSRRARGPLRTGSLQTGELGNSGGDTQVGPCFGQEGNFIHLLPTYSQEAHPT